MPQRSHAFALAAAGAIVAALSSGAVVPSSAQEGDGGAREAHVRPQTRLVPQRQWEYMQLECIPSAAGQREREDRLNEHGKRGWELVSLLEVQHPPGRGCLLRPSSVRS